MRKLLLLCGVVALLVVPSALALQSMSANVSGDAVSFSYQSNSRETLYITVLCNDGVSETVNVTQLAASVFALPAGSHSCSAALFYYVSRKQVEDFVPQHLVASTAFSIS